MSNGRVKQIKCHEPLTLEKLNLNEWDIKRLFAKIDKDDNPDHCWTWQASSGGGGPQFSVHNDTWEARKIAALYTHAVKEIPAFTHMRSTCGNSICVNPKHCIIKPYSNQIKQRIMMRLSELENEKHQSQYTPDSDASRYQFLRESNAAVIPFPGSIHILVNGEQYLADTLDEAVELARRG